MILKMMKFTGRNDTSEFAFKTFDSSRVQIGLNEFLMKMCLDFGIIQSSPPIV